ncbi:MAG: hypothetical protein P9M03_02145 [Candidatus Theseobacter exili]|nr:hypothetical protein [Candidatus Theseobacter exili]
MKVFLFLLIFFSIVILGTLYFWLDLREKSSSEDNKISVDKKSQIQSDKDSSSDEDIAKSRKNRSSSIRSSFETSHAGTQAARRKVIEKLQPERRKRKKISSGIQQSSHRKRKIKEREDWYRNNVSTNAE